MTTAIDDLLALLPDYESVDAYTLAPQPGASTGNLIGLARIKEILTLLNAGGGSDGQWLDVTSYAAEAETGVDNTTALQAASNDADTVGAAGIKFPYVLPGKQWEIAGRVYLPGSVALKGCGPNNTTILCTHAGAGLDFSYYDDTGQGGGHSSGFTVQGGGIATRPMVIGKRVSAHFSNFGSKNADMNTGVNLICDSTQNTLIEVPWLVAGACNLRFDRGASSNNVYKGEIAGAGNGSNVEYRATSASPPGQFSYTLDNLLLGCIIEGSTADTIHMIHSKAGALNKIVNCYLSINGSVFGAAQPTAMVQAVYAEASGGGGGGESVQSSLMIDNLQMNCSDDCDIAVEAHFASGARIHWKGGSIGAVALGMKGNVLIEADPWFFANVTQWYYLAAIVTARPRREIRHTLYFDGPSSGETAWMGGVHGDSAGFRWFMSYQGVWSYNFDGAGGSDLIWGPLAAGIIGTSSTGMIRTGLNTTANRPAAPTMGCQFYDTTLHKPIWWNGTAWADAAGTVV